jgi:uroporphyrinogen-III decarboxylase
MMTNRERLFAVLSGEPPDRVPIWLLFPYHQIGCYTDVRTNPRYSEIYELSRERAVMLDRRVMPVPIFAPQARTRSEEFTDGAWQVERDHLEWDDVQLFSEIRRNGTEVRIKKAIENEDDLLAFARLPINNDPALIEKQLDARLPAYLAEKAEFPEEYGSMMLALGEPIGALYARSNLTEYPIWSLTQNDTVVELLQRLMVRYRLVYKYCLERDLADCYFLIGSELASPPMVSRGTFQQWIVPFAKELIELVHSYGKKAIQHYHGQISEVLPDFLTMAPDALHTIEAPPVGDTTLAEAFDVVGDQIALIGNIQYDCFRSHTREQMREAVGAVLEETRGKRFILSPSAGPYEDEISERVRNNYLEFMNAGWECGACVS